MVGAPLAAGLLMMDGLRGLRGWQWIYIMEGSLTMSYALVLFSFLAREPGVAWFLRPAERDWLARRQFTAHQHAHDANPSAGTRLGPHLPAASPCLLAQYAWMLAGSLVSLLVSQLALALASLPVCHGLYVP